MAIVRVHYRDGRNMLAAWLDKLDAMLARRRIARCHNIADLRHVARRRLPRPMFDYMDGAADDEQTLQRNCGDFARYELVPRALVDVSAIDPSTTVLGECVAFPVVLAPTGMSRLFHHRGERAVAAAAARAGTVYSLSTLATTSIEDVAAVSGGPKWFQLYVFRDRGLTMEFMQRCKSSDYKALCLTVDVPVAGNRERDLRTGMTLPPRLTPASWLEFARHPWWSLNHVLAPGFTLANVAHKAEAGAGDVNTVVAYIGAQFDPALTWDDAAWMAAQWQGRFAVKGILSPADAVRAVEIGAGAIIVSNHGGRQLDHAASPMAMLPEIAAAVGGRAEIIVDGGVRRGTDVLKALALGARACMVGRAYLYGLGAGGEAGVDRALALLRAEIVRDMALLGCRSVGEITADHVRRSWAA